MSTQIYNEVFEDFKERMNKSLSSDIEYTKYTKDKIKLKQNDEDYIFCYQYDSVSYEIEVSKQDSDYLPFFEEGLLHPQVIGCWGTAMTVGQFKEFSKTSDETKRTYTLWSWCKDFMNPCEYTIELLNEKATKGMSIKDFVENAIVVRVSPCSLII